MKYSITYKITAIFLSSLVLFSSLSFSVEKHFCEGEMRSSFFKDAVELCDMQSTGCHSDEATATCCSVSIEPSDCCVDTSEFIEGISIEERARSEQRISLQPVVVLVSTFILENLYIVKNRYAVLHASTSLLISVDIGVLFQVFII